MTRFLDGPEVIQRTTLNLQRSPLYLRVVININTAAVDALDQLDDEPGEKEAIHVYRRIGPANRYFVDYRDKRGRRCGETFSAAVYRFYEPQPPAAIAYDREAWQRWAAEQPQGEASENEIQQATIDAATGARADERGLRLVSPLFARTGAEGGRPLAMQAVPPRGPAEAHGLDRVD